MRKISVAIISGSVGKSPETIAASFVFDEAYRLAKTGVEVHIIRPKFEKDSFSYGMRYHGLRTKVDLDAIRFMLRNISTYPPISILRNPALIYGENLYALNVLRVIEDHRVDIIHAHFAYLSGLVGLLVKREIERTHARVRPLVVTLHGVDVLTEPSIKYGARLDIRVDAIVKEVLNHADAVIVASKATYKEACKIIKESSKVHLLPNGVDTKRFNPSLDGSYVRRKLGLEERAVVFSLRAHEPKYGLEYLIRAAPMVIRKNKDVVFVIGSDGPLKSFHEWLATKLGVRENMIFTGRLSYSEVPYYYAMSDIVVVPSLQEAFGLVVSEAMACAKPVIGTEVGGIPDQIINGYNGFLVPPRKPEQIAEKILWLLDHPQESRQMGINGRKVVEEKFCIDRRIKQLIALYEDLLR